jgi:YbbR domain-containing protein
MAIKRKIKKLFDISDESTRTRIILQALSLVFAVSLWLFVAWDSASPSVRNLVVPIKYLDLQDGYSITNISSDIEVTLEGRIERIVLLDKDDVTALVSVQDLRPGKYRLPVQLEIPNGVRLAGYSPQAVDIELFRIIERTLRPSLIVSGDVPPNLSLGEVAINPREVVVRGSETEILAVRRAEVRSDVERLVAGVNDDLPVMLVTDSGDANGIKPEPPMVRVLARLTETMDQKRVPVRVFIEGIPREGLDIGSVSISPDMVTLRGTKNALQRVNEILLNAIDVTGHSENIDFDLPLDSPAPDIAIVSADRVKVMVEFISAVETVTFQGVPISVEGRGSYDEWVLSPSSVNVTLERTVADTEPFDLARPPVELFVDVTNIVSRRMSLPILVRGIPEGVRKIHVDPEQVTINGVMH